MAAPPPVASVFDPGPGEALDASAVSNDEAWQSGRELVLGAHRLAIVRNPPMIQKLDVYGEVFADVPIVSVPQVDPGGMGFFF